jgi:GTP-binding protein
MGSIVALSGIEDLHIGDTVCDLGTPDAIPFQKIEDPTISMNFCVNDSPFAGQKASLSPPVISETVCTAR